MMYFPIKIARPFKFGNNNFGNQMALGYFEGLVAVFLVWALISVRTDVSATSFKTPRLSNYPTTIMRDYSTEDSSAVKRSKVHYYTQTLDHFNYRPESYITFQQKYILDFTYWGGANVSAPIFVYLGPESALGDTILINALYPQSNALIVAIEHRYYGESIPFRSKRNAFENATTLGYLSSAQALADYAEVILHIKKTLFAESCPVVVLGESYGGMLASWFRLKYPHIAIGAVASSAPILYFMGFKPRIGYFDIVSMEFRDTSTCCHDTIRKSWSKIDSIGKLKNGLSILTRKFKTCKPLNSSSELEDYLNSIYCTAVQYNRGPKYMLKELCGAIDGAPKGSGIIGRLVAGVAAFGGSQSCYDTSMSEISSQNGWDWQTCTEMVMPTGQGIKSTMYEYSPFDLKDYIKSCHKVFSVDPRPHWITTEFGGHDIKRVLAKFGSNIIFSNGLKDPYSSGGVLHNISDSIVALTTAEGSHCLDLSRPSPTDPDWLIRQRASEMEIIAGWIANYSTTQHKL